VKDLY